MQIAQDRLQVNPYTFNFMAYDMEPLSYAGLDPGFCQGEDSATSEVWSTSFLGGLRACPQKKKALWIWWACLLEFANSLIKLNIATELKLLVYWWEAKEMWRRGFGGGIRPPALHPKFDMRYTGCLKSRNNMKAFELVHSALQKHYKRALTDNY